MKPTRHIQIRILAAFAGLLLMAVATAGQPQPDGTGIFVNKRPLKDFAYYAKGKIESKAINLGAPFSVEVKGKLDKSGKIDPATIVYTKSEGDKQMVEIVKKAIESVNDAGYLDYVSKLGHGGGDVIIRAAQDDSTFTSSLSADALDERKARTTATGLQMLVRMAIIGKEESTDKDELLILQSLTVSTDGKTYTVKVNMPKASFREMIERKLVVTDAEPKS